MKREKLVKFNEELGKVVNGVEGCIARVCTFLKSKKGRLIKAIFFVLLALGLGLYLSVSGKDKIIREDEVNRKSSMNEEVILLNGKEEANEVVNLNGKEEVNDELRLNEKEAVNKASINELLGVDIDDETFLRYEGLIGDDLENGDEEALMGHIKELYGLRGKENKDYGIEERD